MEELFTIYVNNNSVIALNESESITRAAHQVKKLTIMLKHGST